MSNNPNSDSAQGRGYVGVSAWARTLKTGSHQAKTVFMILASHADGSGKCWPSRKTLHEECEMSPASVGRYLRILERDLGVMSRQRRRRGSCIFTLNVPPEFKNEGSQ
jgi:hypothetical protein